MHSARVHLLCAEILTFLSKQYRQQGLNYKLLIYKVIDTVNYLFQELKLLGKDIVLEN